MDLFCKYCNFFEGWGELLKVLNLVFFIDLFFFMLEGIIGGGGNWILGRVVLILGKVKVFCFLLDVGVFVFCILDLSLVFGFI